MSIQLKLATMPDNCIECKVRMLIGCNLEELNGSERPAYCPLKPENKGEMIRKKVRYVCGSCGKKYYKLKNYCPNCGMRNIKVKIEQKKEKK